MVGTFPIVKLQNPGQPKATTHSQTSGMMIVVKESSKLGSTCVKLQENSASVVQSVGSRSIVEHACCS